MPLRRRPISRTGLLELLGERYPGGWSSLSPEDLFAYAYALLATPDYVKTFWDELALPGPRSYLLTQDAALFAEGAALGRRLIWLHTYGERFRLPPGAKPGRVPPGVARCQVGYALRSSQSIPTASTTIPLRRNCISAKAYLPRCGAKSGVSACPASRW